LRQGKAVKSASFIEVHIWGTISEGTIERVTVPRREINKYKISSGDFVFNEHLPTILNQFGIELELR
jgi:hypothetical protein